MPEKDEGARLRCAAAEGALAAAEEDRARAAAAAPPRYRAACSFEPTETWQLALARGDTLLLLDADRSNEVFDRLLKPSPARYRHRLR